MSNPTVPTPRLNSATLVRPTLVCLLGADARLAQNDEPEARDLTAADLAEIDAGQDWRETPSSPRYQAVMQAEQLQDRIRLGGLL